MAISHISMNEALRLAQTLRRCCNLATSLQAELTAARQQMEAHIDYAPNPADLSAIATATGCAAEHATALYNIVAGAQGVMTTDQNIKDVIARLS